MLAVDVHLPILTVVDFASSEVYHVVVLGFLEGSIDLGVVNIRWCRQYTGRMGFLVQLPFSRVSAKSDGGYMLSVWGYSRAREVVSA